MWKSKKGKFKITAIGFLLLLLGFSGCGKKEAEPSVALQELIVEYILDNPLAYAAQEDGGVYIVNFEQEKEGVSGYRLYHFDGQGQQEWHIDLGEEYSMVEALVVSEDRGQVYFTSQNSACGDGLYLFSCSADGEEITMLCELSYFDHIKQLAMVGDVLYLLGQSPNWQVKEPPDSGYLFSGERLVAYHCDTGEQMQMGFDFPVSMSASGKGSLLVFGYLDGNGYCMMEYDQEKDSMQVVSRLENYKFDRFAACNGGKDIIYDYNPNSRGLVLSNILELSVEAELYPDAITLLIPPGYAGGRVYCYSMETSSLISFPLEAVHRNNKELTFISKENGALNAPYGCGYSISRMELTDEKFTMKILARDKDFDLCMGNTLLGRGRELRENGGFYPLNDVPEIEEYLDRCFPYVREAATQEDGTIWMLPVNVNIYGMAVKQDEAKKAGFSLENGMTWEGFAQMFVGTTDEYRKRMVVGSNFLSTVFGYQYFTRYHTLEGEVFSNAYGALTQIWELAHGAKVTGDDYILETMGAPMWLNSDHARQQYGEDVVYIALPKPNATDKNIANCVFLAVNPDSAQRKEALDYLKTLAAYLSQRGALPFFQDWQGEGALDKSLYEVYENGEIGFAVDNDIYEEGFEELFSGKLSLSEYIEKTEPKLKMYWGE